MCRNISVQIKFINYKLFFLVTDSILKLVNYILDYDEIFLSVIYYKSIVSSSKNFSNFRGTSSLIEFFISLILLLNQHHILTMYFCVYYSVLLKHLSFLYLCNITVNTNMFDSSSHLCGVVMTILTSNYFSQ